MKATVFDKLSYIYILAIFVDFINERKKQYKDRNGYDSVILLFHSSNAESYNFLVQVLHKHNCFQES